MQKNKNHQSGKLDLKLLDYPWTHGAQYLLPRVYLVGEVRFHIEYTILPVIQSYKVG